MKKKDDIFEDIYAESIQCISNIIPTIDMDLANDTFVTLNKLEHKLTHHLLGNYNVLDKSEIDEYIRLLILIGWGQGKLDDHLADINLANDERSSS